MLSALSGLNPEPSDPAAAAVVDRWTYVFLMPAIGLALWGFGWWLARHVPLPVGASVPMTGGWVGTLAIPGLALASLAVTLVLFGEAALRWEWLLTDIHRHAGPDVALRWGEGLLLIGILLIWPVGEELFFRGAFWDTLGRFWPPGRVMAATFLLSLLESTSGDWENILIMLPSTIAFTAARWLGGSVRSSILCHLVHSAGACLWVLSGLIVVRFS